MFSALANKNINLDIKNSLHKFIALSPCVAANVGGIDEAYYENGLYKFPEAGIHSIFGPNWEENLAKICAQFSKEVCNEYSSMEERLLKFGGDKV